MVVRDRAAFVAAYSRLVAEVWADPVAERMLTEDPRALLAEFGLTVPDEVTVRVERDVSDAEPDLDAQVRAWLEAPERGVFALFVPATDQVDSAELDDAELDGVVGGLDSACACCCPCCSAP
jgi:hypothetical protein